MSSPKDDDLYVLLRQRTEDLDEALAAIVELMEIDKGPTEAEFIEWANRHLPLVQRLGQMTDTVGFQ